MSEPMQLTLPAMLAHCDQLAASNAFAWFVNTALTVPMEEADKVIHDLNKPLAEREAALHKWNALDAVRRFVPEQQKSIANEIAQRNRNAR